jgi:hypothetical protein
MTVKDSLVLCNDPPGFSIAAFICSDSDSRNCVRLLWIASKVTHSSESGMGKGFLLKMERESEV